MTKQSVFKKWLSLVLCAALLVTVFPVAVFAAQGFSAQSRISDTSTMDGWKNYFPVTGTITTENAGGVWTDKSVFTDASAFKGTGITMDSTDSFLVALSAIGSNMTVAGMTNTPTDTMFVLDVSGSMEEIGMADELVKAANASIASLLSANPYNRVGVVLYSGPYYQNETGYASDATVILPLGRYLPSTAAGIPASEKYNGNYLTHSTSGGESVDVDNDVVNEATGRAPSARAKDVSGCTYIQAGLSAAAAQFTATSNTTTTTNDTIGTVAHKPVLVLLSDGAPTLGTTNFTNPQSTNVGTGGGTSAALGFVTQLTAAYVKTQIEEKYKTKCSFYTLGLGTGSDVVATSVLDPDNSSASITTLWTNYNNAQVDDTVTVQSSTGFFGSGRRSVTKISTPLSVSYVDDYFAVAADSADPAKDLLAAFEKIVGDIVLQSKYFPTLITDSEQLSGYVSFVDKIGSYMSVTDVKGILINNTLFSGADLASNFVAGGGSLGTTANPTDLGNELVFAVQKRLGITDIDVARTLINLAFQYGQLSYTDKNNYSNYIGWYANAAGQFLGFYHEGVTVLPAATGNAATDPAYTVKSYGYLGAVNEAQGVAKSDLMYATVQVRKSVTDGEETVTFAVPAALIPLITYNVNLGADNNTLTALTVSGATNPIRLVYEVALDSDINEYNLKEKVSAQYLAQNTNPDGSVNFYTNKYEVNNTTGYDKVNTYSYFRPSTQNDRLYYTQDSLIYTDVNGTLYTSETAPTAYNGKLYRKHTVYEKNGALTKREGYHELTSTVLLDAVKQTDETGVSWVIPAGHVRLDYATYTVNKASNQTSTLTYAAQPFVDYEHPHVAESGHSYVVGSTLGNNGKYTVTPGTGIKISKALAAGTPATETAFEFTVTNTSNASDNKTYNAMLVNAAGTESTTTVKFTSGSAKVNLKAGETLYITGMTAGNVFKVTETETAQYVGNANVSTVTVVSGSFASVDYVNSLRKTGNITVAKNVEHGFGAEYNIPADKTFDITVTLSGIGTANARIAATQTDSNITYVTTDANGSFTVTLKNNQQITLTGLPEGTVATVTEKNPGEGFAAKYWEGDTWGDGIRTVEADTTVSVIVVNGYTPAKVYPVNISVDGTKALEGRAWNSSDEFTFELQKWIPDNAQSGKWELMATAKATSANKSFSFDEAFKAEEYTVAGTYYYRVVEKEPETGGISGVAYDKTVHSFSVYVTDLNMDGKLEINDVRSSRPETTVVTKPAADSYNVTVNFKNTYSVTGNATVTVDLNKKVVNESGSTNAKLSGFTFGLYNADSSLAFTSAATTDRGFARFVLNYTEAGTYSYTLKEIIPSSPAAGWTYSTQQFKVTVVVTDNGAGGLKAVIYTGDTMPANPGNSVSTEFINTYAPASAELKIDFVKKELIGRTLKANEFAFAVKSLEGATLLTGTNSADGKVTFNGTLKFDKVGTYFYNIVEIGVSGNGVTMDSTVYRVTVTVSDIDGVLKAAYAIVNVAGDEIVFKNTYTSTTVSYAVKGEKRLDGKQLLNDEFTFTLTEATDAKGTLKAGAVPVNAQNFIDGSIVFPEITYTEAGVYYYVVSEQIPDENEMGITFDKTVYVVTVTVKDDGKGMLSVSNVDYTANGKSAENILFVNKYVAAATTGSISGEKILIGKVLTGGEFSFELYSATKVWTEDEKLETVQNAKDGSIVFPEIKYEKAGVYNYIVKEVNGGKTIDGITYDSTVYRVTVTVIDDFRGNLHTETVVFDSEGVPQTGIVFENIYTEPDAPVIDPITVDVTVNKTVENKGTGSITPEGFEFTLTPEGGKSHKSVSDKDGLAVFTLQYTKEDAGKTFTYVLEEVNTEEEYVTYSTEKYTVTVTVTLEGDVLKAALTKNGEAVTAVNAEFVNIYDDSDTPQLGDENNSVLFMALAMISAVALGIVVTRKQKLKIK